MHWFFKALGTVKLKIQRLLFGLLVRLVLDLGTQQVSDGKTQWGMEMEILDFQAIPVMRTHSHKAVNDYLYLGYEYINLKTQIPKICFL